MKDYRAHIRTHPLHVRHQKPRGILQTRKLSRRILYEADEKIPSQKIVYARVGKNLKFAITQAIKGISQNDLISFYRHAELC